MVDYKISVIVAAYNIEQYISKCLDSIINQTYKNLEIIVVDDGSSDGTGRIADEYAGIDNRIVVVHKENGGVSSARNRGIDTATGDYIGFVDGDDTIEADMYEMLISNAVKYGADISHCGYKLVEKDKEVLIHGSDKVIVQDRKKGILDIMDGSLVEPGIWNKIFKKNVMGETRLDESLKINEDLYFNILLFNKSSKSVFEDKAKYNYIKREGSATTSSLNNIRRVTDPRKVYRKIVELFEDNVDILPYAKSMDIGRNVNLYNVLILKKGKEIFKLKEEVRDYIKSKQIEAKKNDKVSKKTKLMMFGIIHMRIIYEFMYKLYFNKKYD